MCPRTCKSAHSHIHPQVHACYASLLRRLVTRLLHSSPLPTPHAPFPTPHFPLQTPHSTLHTPYFTPLPSTLHSTPLHCTALHCAPLHSTPLHSAPLHSTPLHSTPLCFAGHGWISTSTTKSKRRRLPCLAIHLAQEEGQGVRHHAGARFPGEAAGCILGVCRGVRGPANDDQVKGSSGRRAIV